MRECSFARLGAVDTGSLECSLCLNAIAATRTDGIRWTAEAAPGPYGRG